MITSGNLVEGLRFEAGGRVRWYAGVTAGLILGPIVGLIGGIGLGSLRRVDCVETVRWKWKRALSRALLGGFVLELRELVDGLVLPAADQTSTGQGVFGVGGDSVKTSRLGDGKSPLGQLNCTVTLAPQHREERGVGQRLGEDLLIAGGCRRFDGLIRQGLRPGRVTEIAVDARQ